MIIKKRPIITWLLNPDTPGFQDGLTLAKPKNFMNLQILKDDLKYLKDIRAMKPKWGLPELVMPSFKMAMEKNTPAFEKIMPELFKEFSETDECGILMLGNNETLVYGFGDGQLNLWFFIEQNSHSVFHFYAGYEYVENHPKLLMTDSILHDDNLLAGTIQNRIYEIGIRFRFIAIYLAVKKHGKVETVIIPQGTYTAIEGTPLEYVEKKKVINQTGQEVIIMDSKWFRKIINDNDIPVKGHYRMLNKKNADGERYQKKIYIEPYIRHGYHRNAKIEDNI
ncbi:hypothetical protein [Muribaculum intestinale]|uniref:hypothetical protein n=1 Tax=Muribaculum intestinale TaxID=1796646 RepID=UPI0025AA226E|nr:hypothetical protein [Muribaculum intestinale]